MESWTALGEILAGTKILRRFYALNPEKVAIAVPVERPTRIQTQQAKERAQREAIRREREGILLERLSSPKPSTRLKGLQNQEDEGHRAGRICRSMDYDLNAFLGVMYITPLYTDLVTFTWNVVPIAKMDPTIKGGNSSEELKKSGYILQDDPDYYTVRLRVVGGNLTSSQLSAIARIAEKYGIGRIHLTARQGIQISYVRYNKLGEITRELKIAGTPPGSCGPRVRNIVACVGKPECPHAIINTYELAKKIDEKYFAQDLPTKLKIAITGCPNACMKPQLNDIGVMGVVEPRIISEKCDGCGVCLRTCKEAAIKILDGKAVVDYTKCVYCGECIRVCPIGADIAEKEGYAIFVGGCVGRHPRLAYKLVEFANEEQIFKVIENSVEVFNGIAVRGERFGSLINRLGVGEFGRRVLT